MWIVFAAWVSVQSHENSLVAARTRLREDFDKQTDELRRELKSKVSSLEERLLTTRKALEEEREIATNAKQEADSSAQDAAYYQTQAQQAMNELQLLRESTLTSVPARTAVCCCRNSFVCCWFVVKLLKPAKQWF